MEAQIQVRRATAAQWISANPILTAGEPGFETDTGKGKYGNGTAHWNALGYSWALLANGPTGAAGGSLSGSYPNPTLALNSVGSPQIIDGGVGNAELATGAVTTAKIGDNQVTGVKIPDAAIVGAKLAPNAVTTDKIADGTIALADLNAGTVSALKLDIMDEGTAVLNDADKINFIGDGVSVVSGSGIATVTITGAPASAIIPGTIVDWYDPVPPAGWYRCDGSVQVDMAGTVGTRYGVAGTLPLYLPIAVDADTGLNSDVIASTQPGWQITTVRARRMNGQVTLFVQIARTGANIDLANPNHSDQTVASIRPAWTPDSTYGGNCNNAPRFGTVTNGGSLTLNAGIADHDANSANILRDDVYMFTYNYPAPQTQNLPSTYKIIKAPATV